MVFLKILECLINIPFIRDNQNYIVLAFTHSFKVHAFIMYYKAISEG